MEVSPGQWNSSVQFSQSVVSDCLQPHGLQQARPPCPSPTPRVYSNSTSIESVMPSNHLILCHPLLLMPSSGTQIKDIHAPSLILSVASAAPCPPDTCVFNLSVVSRSLQPCALWPARLLCPWDFPGKNTGVGCLLQGIFLTQGSNPCLLCLQHWLVDSLPLSHLGSPILQTVGSK